MGKYKCGLLGKELSHSLSPYIHGVIADYEYLLYEKSESELEHFLKIGNWRGLNVTIPYKERVIEYCDYLSDLAVSVGSVNTLVKDDSGKIYGYNTDVSGFAEELGALDIDIRGEKVLVLGSGGASRSVSYVLDILGASYVVISRTGKNNYQNISKHKDAKLIINTTPVGMYPNIGESPIDLGEFIFCRYVIDIIYNPCRTKLLIQAEELDIPCKNGLYMLFVQAVHSSRLFVTNPHIKNISISKDAGEDCFSPSIGHRYTAEDSIETEDAEKKVKLLFNKYSRGRLNIVLIGMPGCGKTTVGKALAKSLGRVQRDSDDIFTEENQLTPEEYIKLKGEAAFRIKESRILSKICRESGIIISTGGGVVTVAENFPLLRQNGIIIWLKRDINKLCIKGRPLSETADLSELFKEREPEYLRFSRFSCDNNGTIEDTADNILSILDSGLDKIL